jgi:hypothetical protein
MIACAADTMRYSRAEVLSYSHAQVTFTTTRQLQLGLFQDFIISQLPAGVLYNYYT